MIAILVAKWVADALEREGVYDLAQTVLGHPFLDLDQAVKLVQKENALVEELIPPKQTMDDITVLIPPSNKVPRSLLASKLDKLKARGLLDAGLVLVSADTHILQGYIAESELDFGLNELYPTTNIEIRLLGHAVDENDEGGEADLTQFVDRTPVCLCAKAPMEYLVEMFGKLGLRHLCVVEEGTGRVVGVVIKKRVVVWLEGLREH